MIGDKIDSFNGVKAARFDYIGSLIRQCGNEVTLVLNGTKEIHARTQMKNPIIYLPGKYVDAKAQCYLLNFLYYNFNIINNRKGHLTSLVSSLF